MRLSASTGQYGSGRIGAAANALREGVQGYDEGVAQGLARKRSEREQALADSALAAAAERAALRKEQRAAQGQIGEIMGRAAPQSVVGTPAYSSPNIVPPGLGGPSAGFDGMQGPMQSWGRSAGQSADYKALQESQKATLAELGGVLGSFDPETQAGVFGKAKEKFAGQALDLEREHTAAEIHDWLSDKTFWPTNPVTGEQQQDQTIEKQVAGLADTLGSGGDPRDVRAKVTSIADAIRDQHVKIVQRKTFAIDMLKDLDTQRQNKMPVTPQAIAAQHAVDTNGPGAEDAAKYWHLYRMGFVPTPGLDGGIDWVSPETAARREALFQSQLQSKNVEGYYKGAQLQESMARAENQRAQADKARRAPAEKPLTGLQKTQADRNIATTLSARFPKGRTEENGAEYDAAFQKARQDAGLEAPSAGGPTTPQGKALKAAAEAAGFSDPAAYLKAKAAGKVK